MSHPRSMRRPRPTWRAACVGLLAATMSTVLVAGCAGPDAGQATGPADSNATPQQGGILKISALDPGTSVDPVTTSSPAGGAVTELVAESLVRVDKDNVVQPSLAEKWAVSGDGLTWTVTLRPDLKFDDGTVLDADDVVASFDRIIGPDSVAPGKSAFTGVLRSVSGSGTQVVFTLDAPFSDFPYLLNGSNTGILPSDYVIGSWQRKPVGAGPFRVKSYSPGNSVIYEKNPYFWDAASIYLDGVELKFYKDQQARVLALQSGESDALLGEPVDSSLTRALDTKRFTVLDRPDSAFTGLALRVDQAPFDDVKVRQAIGWALDRKAIVDNVFGGAATVANDTIYSPLFTIKAQGLTQRAQDAGRVRELLGDRTVAFTITSSPAEQTLAQVIQQQLNKVGGFDVALNVLPSNEYYADGDSAPWLSAPASLTYWAARPSPSQFNNFLYRSGAAWNASKYANPRLDSASTAYDVTVDDAKRQQAVDTAAEIQWQDSPVILPAFQNTKVFYDPKVHGLGAYLNTSVLSGVWLAR